MSFIGRLPQARDLAVRRQPHVFYFRLRHDGRDKTRRQRAGDALTGGKRTYDRSVDLKCVKTFNTSSPITSETAAKEFSGFRIYDFDTKG
jgi:hypothetical protein